MNQPLSLWNFACALYQQPGIADACLELQNTQDVNINVLLLTCWLDYQNLNCPSDNLAMAVAAIAPWHQSMTLALRELRTQINKTTTSDSELICREHIKSAELAAERVELETLETVIATLNLSRRDNHSDNSAWLNLKNHLAGCGVGRKQQHQMEQQIQTALQQLAKNNTGP